LILLSDEPSFGLWIKDIKNGFSMPPRMTRSNIHNIIKRQRWAITTLVQGQPSFKILELYISKGLNRAKLGQFMDATFDGRSSEGRIAPIGVKWKDNLVSKRGDHFNEKLSQHDIPNGKTFP